MSLPVADQMTRVRAGVQSKLAAMDSLLPPVKQPKPFEAYLAQAETRAVADPMFRDKLEQAKAQYRALGGSFNGS